MLFRLMPLLAMLLASPAAAASLTGTWDLQAAGTVLLRIEVQKGQSGWTAVWLEPTHFQTNGESFSNVTGPTTRRVASAACQVADDVELTFDDPRPNSVPDVIRLHLQSANTAQMSYNGTGPEPFTLFRSSTGTPLGPWDPDRTYTAQMDRPTNPEMTTLFEDDQNDRKVEPIDWKVVTASDLKRRERTQQLLEANALHSGTDFYHAAFVFQHGDQPSDYLKAHLLAMVAVARGKADAVWIASATLDRYLQDIGKPQVTGTQYMVNAGRVTQEPYDRALLPDALRAALHVPSLADQEVERQGYEARARAQAANAAATK